MGWQRNGCQDREPGAKDDRRSRSTHESLGRAHCHGSARVSGRAGQGLPGAWRLSLSAGAGARAPDAHGGARHPSVHGLLSGDGGRGHAGARAPAAGGPGLRGHG
ncbi:hypothetical protein D7V97_37050 [Corallococcus sp. CA053C]|nr:hypothetical protein D7V97_37050 [Corallococcus sp. CA053C]